MASPTQSPAPAAPSDAQERLWTPANIVTLVRICCVPVFVVAIISPWPSWFPAWTDAEAFKPWVAAGIFVLLAATDGLDGYLARSRNEVTNFGKFMDPLADKILVAAALLALVELSVLPSWVALVILAREFIVSGIRMVAASQGVVIAASWYGKAKTVTQIVAIVLFIIKDSEVVATVAAVLANPLYLFSWFVMLVAVALTIVSMLDYFVKARELLGFAPSARRMPAASDGTRPARLADVEIEATGTASASSGDAAPRPASAGGAWAPAMATPGDAGPAGACASPFACDDEVRALAEAVVSRAIEQGVTIGTAESLTGGLIAGALTAVPGSSAVVRGGVVSYVNDVKRGMLGVDAATLSRYGAVSEEVACQMAAGAQGRLGVGMAIAATGIAGPGGAEEGKPVGTVWIGLAHAQGVQARRFRFPGDRDEVRRSTVLQALEAASAALGGSSCDVREAAQHPHA